ncbi:uncharacterized protein LOC126756282 [Bactrocera neohumeralis]|uniref:uncharacterized protein LOC126756282 n=1 Tax=Bactrocera neohumeralis TaxID=98809 RepID=UPI0021652C44|nr:uncharacterized protein LOC126756282 [Bactrocera neohumeralis]
MWTRTAYQRPLVLLMLLLQTCSDFNLHADAGVAASTAVLQSAEAEVSSEHTDLYNIRHGRSKVRHSNEKEHLLWAMRPQNTPAGNDNAKAAVNIRLQGAGGRSITANTSQNAADATSGDIIASDYDNQLMSGAVESIAYNLTVRQSRMTAQQLNENQSRLGGLWSIGADSSIQTGNGHLFGSDYWRNSDANGSLISSAEINPAQRVKPATHAMPEKRSHAIATAALHSAIKRKHTETSHISLDYSHQAAKTTDTPDAGPGGLATSEAPVTHRIRKLHMKKIMESIRNSADKGLGVKTSKSHHRSLMTAEQLQGRPMDMELLNGQDSDADETDMQDDDSVEDNADSDAVNSSVDETAADDEDADGVRDFSSRSDEQDADSDNGTAGNEDASDETNDEDMANNSVDGSEDASDNILTSDIDGTSDSDGALNEVLQLADELDISVNSMEDVYQSDEYMTTTSSYVTTRVAESAELTEQVSTSPTLLSGAANELVTKMLNDGAFVETITSAPMEPKKVTTKLQLVQKTVTPTKLTLLPTIATKDFVQSKLATIRKWKNQTQSVAHQNEIATNERSAWHDAGGGAAWRDSLNVHDSVNTKIAASKPEDLVYSHEAHGAIEVSQFQSTDVSNETAPFADEDNETLSTLEPIRSGAEDRDAIWLNSNFSQEPNQLASTSVGGVGLDRQQSFEIEEINFENVVLENADDITMDDGHMDNRNAHGFPVSNTGDVSADVNGSEEDGNETDNGEDDETNRFLAGVVDAANEDEIYDWDEISRNNRRNLMRGRDVVTKFLQIVETQHLLGANCEAGTSLNLGEGVVDRYAQDRFRVEAEVAVNRANMLTRIFKMTAPAAQADVNLLHASVLSMVEFDDDIFAAGNCFDWNEHPSQSGLFCPFAYRLPAPHLGAILAKDLSMEYHYLGNTSEWFFQARKNAEKVIIRNEQYLKSFHLYSNKTDERVEDDTLAVKYEDGRWSKPYYDCGGGNIWMLTYTVPFFGYENGTYHFKGTSGIDIDLRRVDIDQCPQRNSPGTTQPLNIFAGTDKCKQRTTMCEALKGLGFRRGSYKCVCRKGYYFPDTMSSQKFFNGSLLEEEYEKLMLGRNSTYNIINEYECLPCAEGCDYCEDGSPCIAALNWPMRTSILVLACTVIGLLPPAAWFTFRYQQVKVVRAASPALLRVIALGAFFIYCTNIVMYPNPNLYTCTARIWLREIGFSLTYGALMLKTWRISVIFRVRSAKAVKITDAALLKRLGIICGVIGTCLLVRTLVAPPDVVVGRTADDLKAFLCKTDYWDYTFTSMEVLFLAWGVRLCIMVRKAPSEFNESRFISMAIYNEFLLTCFLNVSMLFLQSPANPDLLYIIFFCHTQLTVTLLLCLIFGSKVYIVLRSGKSHQETIGMGAKSSGAKFNFRPQVRTFANPSSVTTSTVPVAGTTSGDTKLSDQEALEEIRQLSVQLQRIQEMAPPKGVAVMTISSLLDGLKTPGGMIMVAAAASQAATSNNQLTVRPYTPGSGGGITASSAGGGALPLLSLNTEMEKYNQQMQTTHNNNVTAAASNAAKPTQPKALMLEVETSTTTIEESLLALREDRAINTDLTRSEDFHQQALGCAQGHIICTRCLVISKEHYFSCRPFTPPHGLVGGNDGCKYSGATCQQLGSPQPEGSISFANIKLECMCSQPDLDIDAEVDVPLRRRINVRSAATNTPPSTRGSSKRRSGRTKTSSPSLQDIGNESLGADVRYRICDNCKNKYRNSNKCGGRKFRKSIKNGRNSRQLSSAATATAAATIIRAGDERHSQKYSLAARTGVTQTRSNDLLERQPATDHTSTAASASQRQKTHSTDDIIFYTTTDESSTNSDDTSDCEGTCIRLRNRQRELTVQSTSALSTVSGGCGTLHKDAVATSEDSMAAACIAAAANVGAVSVEVANNTQSTVDMSHDSNGSVTNEEAKPSSAVVEDNSAPSNGAGRAKRPDKLILDLNDRSKYTKEVSV